MTYQPLPMGWTDVDHQIHAYLHLKGPKTCLDLVDELKLYPHLPRHSQIQCTYRHLKKMWKWGYLFKDKDMTSGKVYWHYAFNGEPEIYVNPAYVHKEA